MIVDHIKNAPLYYALHPSFESAFNFLINSNIQNLDEGKHPIDENCFALISRGIAKGKDGVKLEAHNRNIDIQFINNGTDLIGWKYREECKHTEGVFDVEKDYILYSDQPKEAFHLNKDFFVIFYPSDAHSPLSGNEFFEKVVVKVKML